MPYLSMWLALSLTAGLAGGVFVDDAPALASALILSGGWTAAVLAYQRGWSRTLLVALGVVVCACGWRLGAHAVEGALQPPLRRLLEQRLGGFSIDETREGGRSEPLLLQGRLREDAMPTQTGAVLRLDVEQIWTGPAPEPAAGGVSVSVGGALHGEFFSQWTAGRVVRAPVLLRRPARYFNEGVPDQERVLARRKVALVGTIKSAALVEVVARGRWWEDATARVRARTREAMRRHVRPLGEQASAIATAILIGDRTGLDGTIERRLQEAGTYHVIAISGGNIAIFAGLMLGALSWLGARGRLAVLITMAMLAAYALVAAGGASVARATLMAVLYLAVRLIDQRTAAANAIGLTAAGLLLAEPLAIADVGFWLTFGATGAIVVGASRVPAHGASWARIASGVLMASCCAELALAPVGAMVFQRVTVAGLLLNFAALPAMMAVQIGAMVVVAADLAGLVWVSAAAGRVVHAAAAVLTDSARLVDLAPWLTWRVPSPPPALTFGYYAALVLALAAGSARGRGPLIRRAAASVAAIAFIVIVAAPQARMRDAGDGRLRLSLMDVGQGDAMLVTFPNGRRLVVDTGGVTTRGTFDVGDRVMGPALRARGVLSLDYLAVTHGDPDHIGGARALVRDFEPREVWWGVPVANHEPTALVQAQSARVRAAWRTLQRGDRLEIGGVDVRVHYPPPPDWERQKVRNDDSLVLELRLGDVSILLTGDIGREVEAELVPMLDLRPIVVLKVAHHGSGTSSSAPFLARVRPSVALIGVGRGNPYGHPVPHVLERLRRAGAEIFRTDQDGQIEVVTDGREVQVRTFLGRRFRK